MAPVALGMQITSVPITDANHMLYRRNFVKPEFGEVVNLLGIVSQQTERFVTNKVFQQNTGVREVSRVIGQPQRSIGLIGIFACVLQ